MGPGGCGRVETAGSHSNNSRARREGDEDACGHIVGAAGSTPHRQARFTASTADGSTAEAGNATDATSTAAGGNRTAARGETTSSSMGTSAGMCTASGFDTTSASMGTAAGDAFAPAADDAFAT